MIVWDIEEIEQDKLDVTDLHRNYAELVVECVFKYMLANEARNVRPGQVVMMHSPDNIARDHVARLLADFHEQIKEK